MDKTLHQAGQGRCVQLAEALPAQGAAEALLEPRGVLAHAFVEGFAFAFVVFIGVPQVPQGYGQAAAGDHSAGGALVDRSARQGAGGLKRGCLRYSQVPCQGPMNRLRSVGPTQEAPPRYGGDPHPHHPVHAGLRSGPRNRSE